MDQPLRTDAQEVCPEPPRHAVSFTVDKAVIEERLQARIATDPDLLRYAGQIVGNSQAKLDRIAALEQDIRDKGVERRNLLNEIKSMRAKAWNLFHNARRERKILNRLIKKKPHGDVKVLKHIVTRKKRLRKLVTAQVELEAMKQCRRTINQK